MPLQHIAVMGPGQSGKSTLAKEIVRGMSDNGYDTLVLDPNMEKWDRAKVVMKDEVKFFDLVWKSERCLVVIEEATMTIARDKDLIDLFTRVRHQGHKLCIVGHSGMNLLPIMREQIHFLYLFRQNENACKVWADVMSERRLMDATNLKRYEFLRCIQFGAKDGSNLVSKGTLKIK